MIVYSCIFLRYIYNSIETHSLNLASRYSRIYLIKRAFSWESGLKKAKTLVHPQKNNKVC